MIVGDDLRPAALGGLFLLGVTVTLLELPTAFPYLAAIGILTSEDLPIGGWLPLLIVYNAIFVLPSTLLLLGYRFLGRRGGDRLAQGQDGRGYSVAAPVLSTTTR